VHGALHLKSHHGVIELDVRLHLRLPFVCVALLMTKRTQAGAV
jgi:hypothetical protein